jgi:hypothetical protein
MSVDTFGNHLEEAYFPLEVKYLSLNCVLNSSLLDYGLTSSIVWPIMPIWSVSNFSIHMKTLKHGLDTPYIIILPTYYFQ